MYKKAFIAAGLLSLTTSLTANTTSLSRDQISRVHDKGCLRTIQTDIVIKPASKHAKAQDFVIVRDQSGNEIAYLKDHNGDGIADAFTYSTCSGYGVPTKGMIHQVSFQRFIHQPYMGDDNQMGNWDAYTWNHEYGAHRGSPTQMYGLNYHWNHTQGWTAYLSVTPRDDHARPELLSVGGRTYPYWQTNWWETYGFIAAGQSYCPFRSNPAEAYRCDALYSVARPLRVVDGGIVPPQPPMPPIAPRPPVYNSCQSYAANVDQGFVWDTYTSTYVKKGDFYDRCNANTYFGGTAQVGNLTFLCTQRADGSAWWQCLN